MVKATKVLTGSWSIHLCTCVNMKLALFVLRLVAFSVLLSPGLTWRRRRRRRCYRHCSVSNWSSWSSCTKACGRGTQSRTRYKTVSEQCGGSCPYGMTQTNYCNTQCCKVSCAWKWGPWSSCTSCGWSTQRRVVQILRLPSCGGTACPSTTSQTQRCNTGVWVNSGFLRAFSLNWLCKLQTCYCVRTFSQPPVKFIRLRSVRRHKLLLERCV